MEVEGPKSVPVAESRWVDPKFGILRREHLLVQIYAGAHTPAVADRVVAESREAAKYPTKAALLIHIAPQAKPPDPDSRRKYTGIMQENAALAVGVGYFVSGKGFSASMQRSVLVGLNILASHEMRTHVSSSEDGAIAWLVEMGMSAADGATMEDMLRELEAAMKEAQAAH